MKSHLRDTDRADGGSYALCGKFLGWGAVAIRGVKHCKKCKRLNKKNWLTKL